MPALIVIWCYVSIFSIRKHISWVATHQQHHVAGMRQNLLNIDNPYCEGMVNRIYPPELQLDKVNASDTEALFLELF